MRNALGCLLVVGTVLTTTAAFAQEPPPTQPIVTPPTQPANPPPTAGGTGTAQTPQVMPPKAGGGGNNSEDKKDDGKTDHERVVGSFGVGYFGLTAQPIGTTGQGTAAGVGRGTVQVPVVGVRYWMKERLGIDVGLGLNFFNSSVANEANGVETTTDGAAVIAFALHAGLPLVFAYGKHYKFLLVPEVNFGYATQTEAQQNPPPNTPAAPDVHRTGLRFDVGGRVGTEIQFGFIGVPELALQASVGLNFRRRVWHASQDTTPNPTSSSEGANDFGTTVQSDPWALFTNNIAAIYYFP